MNDFRKAVDVVQAAMMVGFVLLILWAVWSGLS